MEAVPRLPMISFELLTSSTVQFASKLKPYITSFYQEDPESYNNEIYQLECLRVRAVWPAVDITNCQILKKYYCQLHFLKSRFPMEEGQVSAVAFPWKDDYTKMASSVPDINFELMCVLINIGALHSKLGAEDSRGTPEGMKMACTHFQCAAWAFQTVRDVFYKFINLIMISGDQIKGMQMVCLAQAQECILEKSLLDNRNATIVAKIAIQLSDYYRRALQAFQSGFDAIVADHLPNNKYILQYLQFKISYHRCIALLYQGQQAEELQKMGERVAFYQAALEKLEEARKQAEKISSSNQGPFKKTITFTLDVVEGKRKAAVNENEFIYHEDVPKFDVLQEVKGASLVKGIPFNIHDTDVSGPDMFGRLVPMEAHEASSLYSEQKAQLLRLIGERIEKKDYDLNEFMTSMQLDVLGQMKNASGLSQELVDRAASMVARPNATKELIEAMGKLSNTYQEVEAMLKEIQELLREEDHAEKEYQSIMGKRPPSIIATDLSREAAKYQEAHNKASESNQNLHKAMTTHVANLKILAQPISQLRMQIPSLQLPDPNVDEEIVKQMDTLLSKVEEMKNQRMNLWHQIRESTQQDDITNALVTRTPEQSLDSVFQQELEKHKKSEALIDQNLLAQDNICKAIIETYAKFTPTRKYLQDVLTKRNNTISALIASHDTYDDLLAKANKGIEFYSKLETNVSKLLQRIKSACKVQQEERDQILIKNGHVKHSKLEVEVINTTNQTNKPKLKDYLDSMKDKKPGDGAIGPQMQYPNSSLYPTPEANNWNTNGNNQDYFPTQSGYTQQYNTSVNSNNYGSYGYTQVNYADKSIDHSLVNKMNALKMPTTNGQYDYTNSQAYNFPINYPQTTSYSATTTNILHTSVSPQINPANYSNPPSSYQIVSSTNYPYISTSEHYTPNESHKMNGNSTNSYVSYGAYTSTTSAPTMSTNTSMSYSTNYADPNNYYKYNQYPISSSYSSTNTNGQYLNYSQTDGGYQYYGNEAAGYQAPTASYSQNPGVSYSQTPASSYAQNSTETYPTNLATYSQNPIVSYSQAPGTSYGQPPVAPYNQTPAVTYNQTPADTYNQVTPATYSQTPAVSFNQTPADAYSQNPAAPYSSVPAVTYSQPATVTYNPASAVSYSQNPTAYPQNSYSQPNISYNSTIPTTQFETIKSHAAPNNPAPVDAYQNVTGYNPIANPSYATYNPNYNQSYPQTQTPDLNQQVQSNNYSQSQQNINQSNYYNQVTQGYQAPQNTYSQATTSNFQGQDIQTKKESSIDLLAGLDFSISQAPLIPQKEVKPVVKESKPEIKEIVPAKKIEEKKSEQKETKKKEKVLKKGEPFRNSETVKLFLQEVDKFEKYVEGLNLKTLSGPSTLELKWKEIQDAQENMEGAKRSISVARCYPLKNRSPDILPYDFSRVELAGTKDDYINASHIKDLSPYCMDFIITQAPTQATVADFWTMVWEQQIETIVCLLSNTELNEDIYWPAEMGQELTISSKFITILSLTNKEFWTERKLNIMIPEQKENRIVTLLQFTAWPGSLFLTNPLPFVHYLKEIITVYEQQKFNGNPVLVHCQSGVGRSGICCLLLAVLMELAATACPLPDIPSLACKMSTARKNVLRDREHLKFAYTALLSYIQSLKRDYTKSDNEKAEDIQLPKASIDPLSTLDPLWATKKM